MEYLRVKNQHPTWCGPVAVALLTGCSVNDAAQLYANVQNHWRRPSNRNYRMHSTSIVGVWNGETKWVLDLLGFDICHIETAQGLTVRDFVQFGDLLVANVKTLIAVPGHYVVGYRRRVSDNNKLNMEADAHPMADETIDNAWRVEQKPYGDHHELRFIA